MCAERPPRSRRPLRRSRASWSALAAAGGRRASPIRATDPWELEPEHGAVTGDGGEADVPPVRAHEPLRGREAEPGPGVLRVGATLERLEHPRSERFRDARSGVLHL